MYYVYILQSEKDLNFYIGCTNNLKLRFRQHNEGKTRSTKSRVPFKLIYYEALLDKHDAFSREQWLKTGWGNRQIKIILKNYLNYNKQT
jgi:putative endonuclease